MEKQLYRINSYNCATYGIKKFHDFCVDKELEYVLSFSPKADAFDVTVLIPTGLDIGVAPIYSTCGADKVYFLEDFLRDLENELDQLEKYKGVE